MKLSTKLMLFVENFYQKASQKILIFKIYFTSSIFFLFFGFLAGNFFGSLVNILYEFFVWQGLVIMLILIIVETINYLLYHNPNRGPFVLFIFCNVKNFHSNNLFLMNLKKNFLYKLKQTKNKFCCIKNFIFRNSLKKPFSSWILKFKKFFLYDTYKNLPTKNFYNKFTKKILIKNLNLFKIGILLGFFIDAFKVGS